MLQTKCLASKHNLVLDTTGEVTFCCNNTQALNYDLSKTETALTSVIAIAIQQDLDNNIAHPSCQRCWTEQERGTDSYRNSYNQMYPHLDKILDPTLKTIHLQYDNTCNLTCIYCGPKFSSKWANLLGINEPYRNPIDFSDDALANLEMVTLAGGEPSLVKSNIKLLDRLLNLNPNCQVIVNTNLYQIDSNPIFERLYQFQNSTVIASFESVDERYDYIRNGSSWKEFSKNFSTIIDRVGTVQASMILFPLSIGGIQDAIEFALRYIPASEIYINDYNGTDFNWDQVGKTALDNQCRDLVHYTSTLDSALQVQLLPRLSAVESSRDSSYFPKCNNFDQLIKKDHTKIFPELYRNNK